MGRSFVMLVMLGVAAGSNETLAPWGKNSHPTDAPKRHVEKIAVGGNDSICLAGLWKRAGLKVTPARVVGHCVTQCFFDGRWNLFDGDMHSMYLLRDNHTVASEQDLVRDHDLIKRTHTQGILNPDRRANDEWQASIYVFEGRPAGDRNCVQDTTMNMALRPGEAITWRWGHANPVKYHGEKPRYPDLICNGLWEYRPNFSGDLWKKGAVSLSGIKTKGG